jgi:hypothetical protein
LAAPRFGFAHRSLGGSQRRLQHGQSTPQALQPLVKGLYELQLSLRQVALQSGRPAGKLGSSPRQVTDHQRVLRQHHQRAELARAKRHLDSAGNTLVCRV